MSMKAGNKNNGFTLIEILVTLSVSLILISGMVSVLLSSKQSYLRKENINQAQENLRVVSELLRNVLSMTEAVHMDSNRNQIIVSYSGGGGVVNCLGQTVATGRVVNYFFINKNTFYCSPIYPATPGSQQPLIESVMVMRIEYGVDSDKDGQVDGYTGLPMDWDAVISARVLLRLLDSVSQRQPEVTLTVAMRPRIFSRLKGSLP